MKKILFLIPTFELGGSEKMFLNILNSIDLNKFEPILIIVTKSEEGYLSQLRKEIKVLRLNKTRVRNSFFSLINQIRKLKPDIVLSTITELNSIVGIIALLFPKIKFVARESNVLSELLENKKLRKKIIRIFYPFFDRIIAQSDDMKNDLIENFSLDKNRITKINNFIDNEIIEETLKKDINNINLREKKFNILAVGNLKKQKNYISLISIMEKVKNKNIIVSIIGDGPLKEELTNKINLLGLQENIILLGKIKNPYMYMKKSDLFILPSKFEGFPNVLLEALYCGKYCVVNDCKGGINEIITDKNGMVLNFDNPKEVAFILDELSYKTIFSNSEFIKQDIIFRFNKVDLIKKYEELLLM